MNTRKKGFVILIAFAVCCLAVFFVGKFKNKNDNDDERKTTGGHEAVREDGETQGQNENDETRDDITAGYNPDDLVDSNGVLDYNKIAGLERDIVNSMGNIIKTDGFFDMGPYEIKINGSKIYDDYSELEKDFPDGSIDKPVDLVVKYWVVIEYEIQNKTSMTLDWLFYTFGYATMADGGEQMSQGDFCGTGNEITGLEDRGHVKIKQGETKKIVAVYEFLESDFEYRGLNGMEDAEKPEIYLTYRRSFSSGNGYRDGLELKKNNDYIFFECEFDRLK